MITLEDQLTDDLTDEERRRQSTGGTATGTAMPRTPTAGQQPAGTSIQDNTPTSTAAPSAAPAATPQSYRIQPVDQAKYADPNHRTGKYDFLRAASQFDSTKGITPEALAAFNKLGYGTFAGSGDRMSLTGVTDAGRAAGIDPHDFQGDFIQDFGGPNSQWNWDWYDGGGGGQPNQQIDNGGIARGPNGVDQNWNGTGGTEAEWRARYPAPGGGGESSGTSRNGLGGIAGSTTLEDLMTKLVAQQQEQMGQNKGFNDRIHSGLLSEIDANSGPVDENANNITQPMSAYSGEVNRNRAAEQEAMAARGQSQGLTTGAMDAGLQSSYENAGQMKGSYKADLIKNELAAKRQGLQHALSTGAGLLTADEARNLQQQIAALDTRIKKTDIDQSGRIADRDLDVRSQLGNRGLDQSATAETNQNNRFYDQMGVNVGDRESVLNQQMMQMLMGG